MTVAEGLMRYNFYTGSYGRSGEISITFNELDTENGLISSVWESKEAEYPSFVLPHPEGKVLYAVRELTSEGALNVCRIEGTSRAGDPLSLIKTLPTLGQDPCFITLDESRRYLAVINYTGSSFAIFRLDSEGIPQSMTAHIGHEGHGPRADRQEKAHPHCAVFSGDRLFVTDLGMDRLFCYRFDRETGKAEEEYSLHFPEGSGPRHICRPVNDPEIMYINGELASKVFTVRLNEGGAEIIGEVSTLPEDFEGDNITAAIRLDDTGRFLFVSNRGDDSIAAFRIGDMLLIANERSDVITSLTFDISTGKLFPCGVCRKLIKPTCIMKEAR